MILIKTILPKPIKRKLKVLYNRLFGANKIRVPKGNIFLRGDSIMRNCRIFVHGKNNRIIIGGGNLLNNCKIEVFGDNCQILIGKDNCFIDSIFWLEDRGSKIIIGDSNNFCGKVHMGIVEGTTLAIGNNCLLSSDIYITTTDSHSIIDIESSQRINPSKDIQISDHVWIGHRATIGKGVHIPFDCIIGGSSYLTKSVSNSHVIVAGVPARVIKENITWNIKRI